MTFGKYVPDPPGIGKKFPCELREVIVPISVPHRSIYTILDTTPRRVRGTLSLSAGCYCLDFVVGKQKLGRLVSKALEASGSSAEVAEAEAREAEEEAGFPPVGHKARMPINYIEKVEVEEEGRTSSLGVVCGKGKTLVLHVGGWNRGGYGTHRFVFDSDADLREMVSLIEHARKKKY